MSAHGNSSISAQGNSSVSWWIEHSGKATSVREARTRIRRGEEQAMGVLSRLLRHILEARGCPCHGADVAAARGAPARAVTRVPAASHLACHPGLHQLAVVPRAQLPRDAHKHVAGLPRKPTMLSKITVNSGAVTHPMKAPAASDANEWRCRSACR
jgi:hypothetical protein